VDVTKFLEGNSQWLKASDLRGHEVKVRISEVTTAEFDNGTKLALKFHGKDKGMILNQTNARKLGKAFGHDSDNWANQEVILYAEDVEFQGRLVEGLRLRVPTPPPPEELSDEIPF